MNSIARGVRDLRFELLQPETLSTERWDEVVKLRQEYYDATMRPRTAEEIGYFVGRTTLESWDNPNKGDLRGSYARTRVAAAYDQRDNLVGYAYAADNTSSSKPTGMNLAERMAKMYLPQFVDKRYHWQREIVDNRQGRPGLREALGALTIRPLIEQPVSIWVAAEETELHEEVAIWGAGVHGTEESQIYGPGTDPTVMTMYKAPSNLLVVSNIVQYAQPAVNYAWSHTKNRMKG